VSIGVPTETTGTDRLRHVFKHVVALQSGPSDAIRLRHIHELCPTVDDWRRMLSAIPLDKQSFQLDVGVQRETAIDRLARWCPAFKTSRTGGHTKAEARTHGYLSVLLITLITMAEGARPDTDTTNAPDAAGETVPTGHDCDALCRPLLRDAAVHSVLLDLYAPSDEECPAGEPCAEEWARIDTAALEFHRHGTTSFILSGLPSRQSAGRRIKFAFKCVLFPYSNIAVIAAKTRTYAVEHNAVDMAGRSVEHMVQVWASTSHWILMDFAEGHTLAEEIERIRHDPATVAVTWRRRRVTSPAGNVRLDVLRRLGLPLLAALSELHACGKRHEDLSPTNIIVRRRDGGRGEYEVTFIDFGRNYLYTGAVGGLEGAEGAFVAPEVRTNADDVTRADVYSLGRILIALGDVGHNGDGTIPDRFYGQTPLIARLIEDLIDQRPDRRLLIFTVAPGNTNVYQSLRGVLEQELDATQAELVDDVAIRPYAIPYDRQTVAAMVKGLFTLSREPKKQRRLYRLRREQGVLSDPRRSMYARWLLVFSILASLNVVATSLVPIYWFLRDIGIGVLNPADEITLRLIGAKPDVIPLIDNLRASDYVLGQVAHNFPARLIGLSFSLAGVRYYMNILGGLTTRVAQSPAMSGVPLRWGTEVAIRVMAVWSSWLILGVNLVEVRWWPIASAIGYTWVVLSNVLCARFAMKFLTLARQRKFSTVPPEHQSIAGLDAFRQWGPTISLYSITVWIFAILIYVGVLKDIYVYAAAVALVNVGLFYIIKTGINALDIRTGLNRCFLAAERLRYEADRYSGLRTPTIEQPPLILVNPD
jgi:serine/threonine protein kinase